MTTTISLLLPYTNEKNTDVRIVQINKNALGNEKKINLYVRG